MNDYEGFEVVTWETRAGWCAYMHHIASGRHVTIRRSSERELAAAMRDNALRLADPDAWYASLGER